MTCFDPASLKDVDDIATNPSTNAHLDAVVQRAMTRRRFIGGLSLAAAGCLASPHALASPARPVFSFAEVSNALTPDDAVAPGHERQVLIRWGDPIFADAPEFDIDAQTAERQARQFGFNNDYVGFVPLSAPGETPARALLCVNHEYTNPLVMFPDYSGPTAQTAAIEKAAHGISVIEIVQDTQGAWQVRRNSSYNRRIMAEGSPIVLTGPAAGHARLKTADDPTGRLVQGTLNNCGGGMTPWGTTLHAEENFNVYFDGKVKDDEAAARLARYHIPAPRTYSWAQYDSRFDLSVNPNEANRYGWIVELDPTDPKSIPRKRTALGRFKHEGAQCIQNKDGRVVVYMGDDQRFDYVYRFVSEKAVNPRDRKANFDLLDHGTLSVARFNDDGSLDWLPLVFGQGQLTPENGFASQADILIDTRLAADALGATKMDRPEDVEPHPSDGRVFVMLTRNKKRDNDDTNAANPRGPNRGGHIVELQAPQRDHGAARFTWSLLVECGPPASASRAGFHPSTSEDGWFVSPDNCAVDADGRLWVATDGNKAGTSDRNDGVFAIETQGSQRGRSRLFYRGPVGSEITGPVFSPDMKTLFVSVQHPGTAGARKLPGFERRARVGDMPTSWPSNDPNAQARSAVIAIRRIDGGKVG